jgi:hypothetical protein
MKRPLATILYSALAVLAIAFFGFSRILPAAAGHSSGAPKPLVAVVNAASPTETLLPLGTATPTLLPLITFPTEAPNGSLFAFIEAPPGALTVPYVNISAFQAGTFSPDVTISGTMNTTDFICPGSPCTIQLQLGETRFVFHAQTPGGQVSATIYATVVAEQRSDGYHVTLTSVSQFARAFGDACLKEWGVEDNIGPSWAEFPPFPYQLNTQIQLHHLAARLIIMGAADTRDCPAGGLSADLDWPNACGLEKVHDQMIAWQNQFDDSIWTWANQIGIPPKIIKTLVEVESQFWPGNSRFYVDEYGLGQMNQLGVDVLLRNNYDLYQQACKQILPSCLSPYVSLPPDQQALVRGVFMAAQDATCPTCQYGVDITKAKQSIAYITQVLRANCDQAKAILDARSATTDYESYWKFTLLSYHSGQTCLANAIKSTKQAGDPVDWAHVGPQVSCPGGRKYVDNFWANLSLFDSYRYMPSGAPIVVVTPIISPTRTPQATSTPILSNATVVVTVYMDINGNGTPEPNEGLDNIPVQLTLPDGKVLSATTQRGVATFDMSGYAAGIQITATLPNLYRSYQFFLPQSGTVPIIFSFAQPTLPGNSP